MFAAMQQELCVVSKFWGFLSPCNKSLWPKKQLIRPSVNTKSAKALGCLSLQCNGAMSCELGNQDESLLLYKIVPGMRWKKSGLSWKRQSRTIKTKAQSWACLTNNCFSWLLCWKSPCQHGAFVRLTFTFWRVFVMAASLFSMWVWIGNQGTMITNNCVTKMSTTKLEAGEPKLIFLVDSYITFSSLIRSIPNSPFVHEDDLSQLPSTFLCGVHNIRFNRGGFLI